MFPARGDVRAGAGWHAGRMTSLYRRAVLVALAGSLLLAAGRATLGTNVEDKADVRAARAFLSALEPGQRERAVFALEAPERLDWHFVPRERPGVKLGELGEGARTAFASLLDAGLSARGVERVEGVIELERLLRELESRPGRPATWRDPDAYAVTVFGEPDGARPWGWRLEGHHLSLTFTRVGEALAVTPAFVGANPARVDGGPGPDGRLLGRQEDLARALVRSLDEGQLALARVAQEAPADVFYTPERRARLDAHDGIVGERLEPAQRALLEQLLEAWLDGWPPPTSAAARERLGPTEGLRFTWMGSLAPGEPHYWRIDGLHAVVEWDNVQNGANHAHCVWRDLERDHGADLLAEHHRKVHGREPSDG